VRVRVRVRMCVQVTQIIRLETQNGTEYFKARGAELNGEVQGIPSGVVVRKRFHIGAEESQDALEVAAYNRQVQCRVALPAARKIRPKRPSMPHSPSVHRCDLTLCNFFKFEQKWSSEHIILWLTHFYSGQHLHLSRWLRRALPKS